MAMVGSKSKGVCQEVLVPGRSTFLLSACNLHLQPSPGGERGAEKEVERDWGLEHVQYRS